MTPSPFFSVVIPSYNCAWCLGAAIDSVLAQSFGDYEIVVVDDGSTDDTVKLLQAYDVRCVHQANAGRAAARNTGIAAARGQWIAFLDADDLWLPSKLEKQREALHRHPESVMIYAQAYALADRILLDGSLDRIGAGRVLGSGRPGCSDCLREFLSSQFDVRTCTVAARRDVLVSLGGFDPQIKITEDWDLFMRLAHCGPVAFVPEPLAIYWLGSFENRLDRARRYDSHQELRRTVEKNIHLLGIDKDDPEFAAEVLALSQWHCALVEHELGNSDAACIHASAALSDLPLFLLKPVAVRVLVEFIYDIHGESSPLEKVERELADLLDSLVGASRHRRILYRRSMGYVHARCAFRAYRAGHPGAGLRYAALAARFDAAWIRNRGLWTSAIRGRKLQLIGTET